MAAVVEQVLASSAAAAAAMIRRGEIGSRELTEVVLGRVDAVNPGLNAVVELRREAALGEAAAADEAVAHGARTGPLHGVPMTIKEAFDVAGLHTTWGNPAFKEFLADRDATVVRRLRAAAAIVVGQTKVAFMLGDFGQTRNDLYGVTSNPWTRPARRAAPPAVRQRRSPPAWRSWSTARIWWARSGSRPASAASTG